MLMRLENFLKMTLKAFLKIYWRRLEDVWQYIRLEKDVLKASSEDAWLRRIYLSWSRRLEDVLKMYSEDEHERYFHQDECLLGYA